MAKDAWPMPAKAPPSPPPPRNTRKGDLWGLGGTLGDPPQGRGPAAFYPLEKERGGLEKHPSPRAGVGGCGVPAGCGQGWGGTGEPGGSGLGGAGWGLMPRAFM